MKRSLFLLTLVALLVSGLPALRAQVVLTSEVHPAVGFTKAGRTELWIKRFDSAAQVVMKTVPGVFADSNIALLDATPDGSMFLLGGRFTYIDPSSSKLVTYTGLISVPANFNPAKGLSQIHFLKEASSTFNNQYFRPLGLISPDGNGGYDWFAVLVSGSGGTTPLAFFHGKLNQNEKDPGVVVDAANADGSVSKVQDWHMSNLAITPDRKYILAVSVSGLSAQQTTVFQPWRWDWNGFNKQLYTSTSAWGSLISLDHTPGSYTDTLFGYTLKANSDGTASLGLIADNGDISFYTYHYESFSSLAQGMESISRSSIPAHEYFFAGQKMGKYQENISDAPDPGMGGDVWYNKKGDSAVFVTHPINDSDLDVAHRNKLSGIYLLAGGSTTLLYNDTSAQELQPVLLNVGVSIPHFGGLKVLSASVPDCDTAKTKSFNVTVQDTSGFVDITVNSVSFSGTDASMYSTSGTFPTTITHGSSVMVPVTFAPTGTPGTRTATMTVTFSNDSTRTIQLSGKSLAVATKGVRAEDAVIAESLTVHPNPFNGSAQVSMTAPESGMAGIVVRDALGRVVYTSELKHVLAGATETFTFDAHELALPSGAYHVTALVGGREASREVVFVR